MDKYDSAYLKGWADAAALKKRNPPIDQHEATSYNAGHSAALAADL